MTTTGSRELLNALSQNTQMGMATLNHMKTKVKDENLYSCIDSQIRGYEDIYQKVKSQLKENQMDEKQPGKMASITSTVGINIQTLGDKTTSHLAEMLIEGSTMGIVDVTRKINNYSDAHSEVLTLAEQLKRFEQGNVENLKKFL